MTYVYGAPLAATNGLRCQTISINFDTVDHMDCENSHVLHERNSSTLAFIRTNSIVVLVIEIIVARVGDNEEPLVIVAIVVAMKRKTLSNRRKTGKTDTYT